MATLFNEIDLKPPSGYLPKKIPQIFDTGQGLRDLVIDVTESKFQSASKFELNSLMFANYKNTPTEKALIGISLHGSGILFSDTFPGSICDSKITEECGAVYLVEQEREIISGCGFSIKNPVLC